MSVLNQPAPAWRLDPEWANDVTDVADLTGKWSVLLFFNVGCAGCTGRAIPFTREIVERYPGVNVVAIHTDFESTTSAERLQIIADDFGLPYPLVRDGGKATFEAYAAEGTPHWVILDPQGNVHKSIFGSLGTTLQRIEYTLTEALK